MSDDYSGLETVAVERQGRLLTVTLNRPERLNAVDRTMHIEIEDLFSAVSADTSVGAVLLRGAGRAFCAGGDISQMARPMGPDERVFSMLGTPMSLVNAFLSLRQPIVAAVHGYATGLGATIALLCDIVLAAEDAQLADTHVAIGLVAGDGGALAWPLALPMGAAKYYLLTGDRISGSEAARAGLVFRAVPGDKLFDAAAAVAQRLADGPAQAVQGTKYTLNRILRQRADLVLETGLLLESGTMLSRDHAEARTAFAEKRAPVFNQPDEAGPPS